MAEFCGLWELVSCDDKFDEYMKTVGVADDKRKLALTALNTGAKVQHDISRSGTSWTIKVITAQGEKVDVYTEGSPVEVNTLDGRKVSVVYALEGSDLVETQTGAGFVSKNVRKVSGDTMTFTFTANGVTCARTYKKIS
ncbi:memory suppression protein [Aplysia californica]|uniref:Memory suppression protein n=1 Tax=Aplysia californica TaxID=6500 RepID=E6Y6Q2_APLCA|nr:memory suppression protein [Aplysia californica]ACN94419.1 memory suppression protein [Aplysia californica]